MEAEGTFFKDQEPAYKKKRVGSVEPLDRPATVSPLPDLPEDLRQKQVRYLLINLNSNNIQSNEQVNTFSLLIEFSQNETPLGISF